jgi:hypothetical protein
MEHVANGFGWVVAIVASGSSQISDVCDVKWVIYAEVLAAQTVSLRVFSLRPNGFDFGRALSLGGA